MSYRPKLIEVALPLLAINEESARDKGIRDHPQSIHRWWARRPLPAVRAVLWASLVDDPSADAALSQQEQDDERLRLFAILERLIKWDNANDPSVLAEARAEIKRCLPDGMPTVLDPFGGGGSIPLEAQRLGLAALSGDLNPVAILIQKAMVEIPPRFHGHAPVHPELAPKLTTWERAQGLAADVEAFGSWLRDECVRRIGSQYPSATDANGMPAVPIAWIWARTVESPDPAWSGAVPLVSSWVLSKRSGQPQVWVEPVVDRTSRTIVYRVRTGGTPTAARTVDRGIGTCIATGSAIPGEYIKSESRAGRMGAHLLAVVAQNADGRTYCSPTEADVRAATVAEPSWLPEGRNPEKLTGGTVFTYGLDEWWKLYTNRQLVTLTTLVDLLAEVQDRVRAAAEQSGYSMDPTRLKDGGSGALAYADAVATYLAFAISKSTDFNCTLSGWDSTNAKIRNVFARQAIPMAWDFAECNILGNRVGSFISQVHGVSAALQALPSGTAGHAVQRDARAMVVTSPGVMISTDPPYYDNISYADLSDFFFVWLRKGLYSIWPDECATLLTPKSEELIANRHRAGSKEAAEAHFESGMAQFMKEVAKAQRSDLPATVYYAYKATETVDGSVRATGWDTFLRGLLDAGLQVTATWPMRTEKPGRMVGLGANALASSIVLACRSRTVDAALASRGQFIVALREELPEAVKLLQSGNIAPVDMAQSTIGPGIRVFSRYAKVVEADGSAMSVADALTLINDVLAEVIDGEEAELDADTRFAVTWYSQHGYNPGRSGDADGQARAKNTSLSGIEAAGIGEPRGGSFRLFERSELDPEWDAATDNRLTVWEATQHLVAALDRSESEAADLLHRLGGYGDRARQLAYVLFQKATEKGWAEEAGAYNGLILAWPALQSMRSSADQDAQQQLL